MSCRTNHFIEKASGYCCRIHRNSLMPNYGGYMIFYASKKDLQTAASIVSRAVPSHTTMTILQNILLEAGNGEIILTASDTELDITTRIPAVVEKRGNIAVDAKMFSDMIRKLPEEEVRIETTENLQVLLTCGSAHFKIGGMNGDEFPERPMIERDESVTISQLSLKSIMSVIPIILSITAAMYLTEKKNFMKMKFIRIIAIFTMIQMTNWLVLSKNWMKNSTD